MKFYYLPDYNDNTYTKFGENSHDAMMAVSGYRRSLKLQVIGEAWRSGYGIVPVFESNRSLDNDERNLACLIQVIDPVMVGANMLDRTSRKSEVKQ